MKKQLSKLLIVCFILATVSISGFAQKTESSKNEKAKEEERQKAREEHQKAIEELQMAEQLALEAEIADFENQVHSEELSRAVENARISYIRGTGDRSDYYFDGDYKIPGVYVVGSSYNSSSFQYSKTVKEANFTKDFTFEIDKEANRGSIDVSGSCKHGEIRITISMPSGKMYTEVLIDEFGSINWSKNFSISEEDKSKTGNWTFMIDAKDATGSFRLSVRSN